MTIKEWLLRAKKQISATDAELILCYVLGEKERSRLVLRENEELPELVMKEIGELVSRRKKGEPLAYIIGKRSFYGRVFLVTSDVLIPRPETETMIDLAVKMAKEPKTILDVGTGSGVIVITVKTIFKNAKVIGVDISEEALLLARKNAETILGQNQSDDTNNAISFIQSDLLDSYFGEEPDYIMANLPYVDEQWEWIDKRSLNYEPGLALFAADNGLACIKKLLNQIAKRNWQKSIIFLEADVSQHKLLVEYAKNLGFSLVEAQGFIVVLQRRT